MRSSNGTRLAGLGPAGLVQRDALGVVTVEDEVQVGDEAVGPTGDRLQERDLIGGHRLVELHDQTLAFDLAEVADQPRRLRIAVHGVGRPVARCVRHRVAVVGRRHGHTALLDRDGAVVVVRAREHVETVVGGVVGERLLAGPLRVALVLPDRAPAPRPAPVRVGDHERGLVAHDRVEELLVTIERRGVQHGPLGIHQAGCRGGDQPVAVARHHDRVLAGHGPRRSEGGRRPGRQRPGEGRRAPRACPARPRRSWAGRGWAGSRPARRTPPGPPGPAPAGTGTRWLRDEGFESARTPGRTGARRRPPRAVGPWGRARRDRTCPPGVGGRARSAGWPRGRIRSGISSRAEYGRSINPGVTGSTVFPQR